MAGELTTGVSERTTTTQNGMAVLQPLPVEHLYRRSAPGQPVGADRELAPAGRRIGQDRALAAVEFGCRTSHPGFNLFVIGRPGLGRHRVVRDVVARHATAKTGRADWVYVHNFDNPHQPRALELPAGRAQMLRDELDRLIDDVQAALPAAFESDDYQNRRNAIDEEFQKRQEDAFEALSEEAAASNVAILKTPMGFAVTPTRDRKVIKPEDFNALPEAEQEKFSKDIERIQEKLAAVLRSLPRWEKERRDRLRTLNREVGTYAVQQSLDEARQKFADMPAVRDHIDAIGRDLSDNVEQLLGAPSGAPAPAQGGLPTGLGGGAFDRYRANVLVSNGKDEGAPVVSEDHPTLMNLLGRVEHMSQQGALVTNFLLIKPGALHLANGGYLLIDIRNILAEPLAWNGLKRALRSRRIKIESPAEYMSLVSTISLQPDPIPLNVKVVLFGERLLYYLLCEFDPDVRDLFKVLVDFEDDVNRSKTSEADFAALIMQIGSEENLLPLDDEAVSRAIEHAARLAQDSEKLSLDIAAIADLVREADTVARDGGGGRISALNVEKAIEDQRYRSGRIRDRSQELVLRDIVRIATDGQAIGEINGLSVMTIGHASFGRPSRITARVRMGTGKLVDIEREVELGGPIHSKGVLILAGFLAARYAPDQPMSLSATLVFEQSYGGVEGDSASAAELFALLSALSQTPIRQDLAVTGSVDQHGRIQAIGGVNFKIEGFFDICSKRGLTGTQGVIIPASNVQHLMLRADVVEACRRGQFAVYAMETIDEGMSLLTGLPAGERGEDGDFPAGSVNKMVDERLRGFAEARRSFAMRESEGEGEAK